MKVDYGKLATIVLTLVGSTILGGIGVVDGSMVERIFILVIGYVLGNGVLAAKNQLPSPLIGRKDPLDDPAIHIALCPDCDGNGRRWDAETDREGRIIAQRCDTCHGTGRTA